MNKLQENCLITYITTHSGNCVCEDCEFFGGVKHLFEIYEVDSFEDNHLRRIWMWLKCQFEEKGTCDLKSLDFEDPTAPKSFEIHDCHIDSYASEPVYEKVEPEEFRNRTTPLPEPRQIGERYITIKEILTNI